MKRLLAIFLLLSSFGWAEIVTKTSYFKTATGTSDIVVSDVGFQPKAIIFFWSHRTETSDTTGSTYYAFGIGAATGTTDEWSVTGTSQDAAATTIVDGGNWSNSCVRITLGNQTTNGAADIKSIDSGGFTLQVSDAFASDFTIGYIALGGSSITNAKAGFTTLLTTSPPVNQGYTGVGFQPDFLLLAGDRRTTDNGITANLSMNFGVATSSSAQWVLHQGSTSAVTTSNTHRYFYTGEVYANGSVTGGLTNRASLYSMDADGFTLNRLEGTNAYILYYLALKGGNYSVGNLTTRTDGNDIAVSSLGFAPVGGLIASHGTTTNTQDSVTSTAEYSIGAFSSDSARLEFSARDEDNVVSNTLCSAGVEFDEVYQNLATSDGTDALMDVKSGGIGLDSVTFVMDDTEAGASNAGYVIFGPASLGGYPVLQQQMKRRAWRY